jgi:hypothetical protein
MKILLDFNAKVRRENIFKSTIRNGSLHEGSNDSKFINALGLLLMGKYTITLIMS